MKSGFAKEGFDIELLSWGSGSVGFSK